MRRENLENEISKIEAKIKELEAAICLPENASDYQMLADLSRELEENKLRHDEALEEWMELE